MSETTGRFELLFVCHANVCRSPMAQWLTRRALADRLGGEATAFTVSSAGTHALVGDAMHPFAAQVLQESGIEVEGFRSNPATVASLTRPHLVLTATRQQRAHCVTLAPTTLRRTFTLRQFARLAGAVDPECLGDLPPARRAQTLMGLITTIRGGLQPVDVADDDVADPVGRPLDGFRDCAGSIRTSVETVIDVIMRT